MVQSFQWVPMKNYLKTVVTIKNYMQRSKILSKEFLGISGSTSINIVKF